MCTSEIGIVLDTIDTILETRLQMILYKQSYYIYYIIPLKYVTSNTFAPPSLAAVCERNQSTSVK